MTATHFEIILALITACALLTLYLSYRNLRRAEAELTEDPGAIDTRIEGDPTTLSNRTAAALARISDDWPGAVSVRERSDREVTFEAHSMRNGGYLGAGTVQFQPTTTPAQTAVQAVFIAKPGGQLTAARALIYLGVVVVAALWFVFHTWTVPHEHPAMSWQSLQMLQCVHVLWPPFMLCSLARQQVRTVRTKLRALVNNLPYDQAA